MFLSIPDPKIWRSLRIWDFMRFMQRKESFFWKTGKKGLTAQGGVQPVMMTLPPIDGERYLDFLCRDNLRRDRILDWLGEPQMIYRHQELYADTAAEIALRENIPLIPVRQTFLRNHRLSQLIAADGIHLTMPGYEQLFDTLADWVKKNI